MTTRTKPRQETTNLASNELRAAGLKVTLPRRKVLEVLETEGARHMSAEDVYRHLQEAGEDVGLATVYRVLTQFENAGLVTRHHFEGGHSVFELNQGSHHDHILCVKCGRVDEFVDEVIEARQDAIAERLGYSMTDHCLYIYGICAECQKEEKSANSD
jgi:Fur family ferric uptake transcriptional regulator